MTPVKLTRAERARMAREVRRELRASGGDIHDASTLIEQRLFADGRFEDARAAEISDYAWAFARFLRPHEARYQ